MRFNNLISRFASAGSLSAILAASSMRICMRSFAILTWNSGLPLLTPDPPRARRRVFYFHTEFGKFFSDFIGSLVITGLPHYFPFPDHVGFFFAYRALAFKEAKYFVRIFQEPGYYAAAFFRRRALVCGSYHVKQRSKRIRRIGVIFKRRPEFFLVCRNLPVLSAAPLYLLHSPVKVIYCTKGVFSVPKRIKREIHIASVVRGGTQVAERRGAEALFFKLRKRVIVAERLGNLFSFKQYESYVHPYLRELLSRCSLALGYLVRVVHGNMVNAACVDVQRFAKVFHRHRGAFYVPAREPFAPWRIPFHLARLFREFPKREVRGIFLPAHFHALAGLQPFLVKPRQLAVILELRGIEINAVFRGISVPFLFQRSDKLYHFFYIVCGLAHDRRLFYLQFLHVGKETFRIIFRNLPCRLLFALRAQFHLVLARIRVRDKMAHVRYVHDVLDLELALDYALYHVLHNVSSEVANVCIVIDRGTTCIDFHFIARRLENFLFSGKSVKELHKISWETKHLYR